jgi:hypothetical protein
MKTAKYHVDGGTVWEVEYDADAPCRCCGDPVVEASMGGTDLCPWCDTGTCRWCGATGILPNIHKCIRKEAPNARD